MEEAEVTEEQPEDEGAEVDENVDEGAEEEEETVRKEAIPTIDTTTTPDSLPDTSFESLAPYISDKSTKAITEMGFTHMTQIQHKTVIPLLKGRSVENGHKLIS